MKRPENRRQDFMSVAYALIAISLVITLVSILFFAALFSLVDAVAVNWGYIQNVNNYTHVSAFIDTLTYSAYLFFHTGEPYLTPHGPDRAVATLEMFTSWVLQMLIIIWAINRLRGERDAQSGS